MSRNPSGQPSDEADKKQLEMAKEEGEAYHRSLLYMANEVADTGGQQHCGDYIVAYALEKAEGMYVLHSEGKFEWVEPSERTTQANRRGRYSFREPVGTGLRIERLHGQRSSPCLSVKGPRSPRPRKNTPPRKPGRGRLSCAHGRSA